MNEEWIVLADIGTDWPDVFGPYVNLRDAQAVEKRLMADNRVFHTELQQIFADPSEYLARLDELLAPETR